MLIIKWVPLIKLSEFRSTSKEKTINLISMKMFQLTNSHPKQEPELLKFIPSAPKPIHLHTVHFAVIYILMLLTRTLTFFSLFFLYMAVRSKHWICWSSLAVQVLRISKMSHYSCLFILFLYHLLSVQLLVIDGWLMLTCWGFF